MKVFKRLKTTLLTCLAVLCAALGGLAFSGLTAFENAVAEDSGKIDSTVFQTDGASVRIFRKDDSGNLVELESIQTSEGEKDQKGIRFHVEMGVGYVYGGKTVIDTSQTNERNGSYKMASGFKTYTLILPTRLLSGDLTVDTDKVMKLDTSEYWFDDEEENLESVGYVWNIPSKWYTDNFSFRGVLCTVAEDGTETVVASTDIAERSVTWVAKKAYEETIDKDTNYWDKDDATLDDKAAEALVKFIPTYSITYKVNGAKTTETVLWGDAPKEVPTGEGVKETWYCTENSEEVDVTKVMDYSENRTLVLETTSSEEFVLTGVAAETDFVVESEVDGVVESNTYHGVKVFATLHREAFENKTQMDIHAVNVEHIRNEEVLCDGIELQGVWTLEEQNSLGEWQMRLFFALDTSTLQSGDQILIKGDSIFYNDGVMYKLTEDYTIDYTKENEVEDYGMFLGKLYNSDVKSITNCSEDASGNEGEPNEFTVRVEFYEDVMINGEFTFEFGPNSDTTKYSYPVYIQCGEDESKIIPISGGRYYWNEGDHKILELIGVGEYENKVFGWHNGDELIGAPGTIIKQNGGYYIFEDEMYAYFLTNGNVDAWGYALGDWVVGDEVAQYTTSEFATQGTVTAINDNGVAENEIRINTTNHWFPDSAKVNMLTTENMSETEPYAVYRTAADGTVTEIEKVRYHGTANGDAYFQILGLCDANDFTVGDVVTIAAGTRFWLGTEYYTVTDKITYYYTGNFWAQNYDVSAMGEVSSASFEERAHNEGTSEHPQTRLYFSAPLTNFTTIDETSNALTVGTGSITFNGKDFNSVEYFYWDANSTFLILHGFAGTNAFGDKVVIEAGTTIWSANNVAYQFTEKVEWVYAGENSANSSVTWSRVRGGVTVSATTENASVRGVGMFAVGETYTLTVAANDEYLVSEVIVNNKELPLSASNTYTFTVEQSNTIVVKAVEGHAVTFSVPTGAVINGGAITNDAHEVVAHGGSLTFTVAASEGYKLTGVSGATDNGDGTYTVENVTAATTVTVSVEKLYKVTYSGENASVTADVTNNSYVENGTTVTLTVSVDSGYTLISVDNATKVNASTYTATVNGADLEIKATALNTVEYQDLLAVENRSWGAASDEYYFGGYTIGASTEDNAHWLNTDASVNGCWYNGNDALITANNGVDILQYIYVNDTSARDAITANVNAGGTLVGSSGWLTNPAASPVYVETTNGSGLLIKILKAYAGESYTLTFKAGFSLIKNDGNVIYLSDDVVYNCVGNAPTRVVEKTVTFNDENGSAYTTKHVVSGQAIGELPEVPAKDGYVGFWTVDGARIDENTVISANQTATPVYALEYQDLLGLEDRTSWASGDHADVVAFGVMDGNSYFKSFTPTGENATCWYKGNTTSIQQNNGVDIMEYIYIQDQSARDALNANTANKSTSVSGLWLSNPAAWPIAVETVGDFWIRLDKTYFGDSFTITFKKGFSLIRNDGEVIYVSSDITYTYANGTLTREENTP